MRDCVANYTEQESNDNVDCALAEENYPNSLRDIPMTRKRRFEDLT